MAPENPSVRERLGSALSQVMESGDHVVADTVAVSGPWALGLRAFQVAGVAAFLAAMIRYGPRTGPVVAPYVPGYAAAGVALFLRQRAFYLVVTGQAVICYRMARRSGAPGPLAFSAPLPAVRAAVGRRSPLGWPVQVRVPGQRPRRLRLSARARWQRDSAEVIAALRAGGATITGPAVPGGP